MQRESEGEKKTDSQTDREGDEGERVRGIQTDRLTDSQTDTERDVGMCA